MNISDLFTSRDFELGNLNDFPVLSQLPEDHVSLDADGEESSRIWQKLDELDLLPVHRESAVELVQLGHMEQQDGTL